jgi:hypothetical protein
MFKRETIKFLIPKGMLSLINSSIDYRDVVPMYINPTSVQTNYSKNISETQTIGGFVMQYWGDKITTMSIQGTTGSGGIDAINVLYEIYKSEQITFKKILLNRQQKLREDIQSTKAGIDQEVNVAQALDQMFLGGAVTNIFNGVTETMDFLKDAVNGVDNSPQTSKVNLLPTLSSLAISLDMYFQGKTYRGYIESMSITENGSNPGHFDYTIQFKSIKEYGERNNFMPWHTNPRDEAGNPIQKPRVGPNGANYNPTFPYVDAKSTPSTARSITRVTDDQVGTSQESGDSNNISRYNKIK